jgi:hypothetical protein
MLYGGLMENPPGKKRISIRNSSLSHLLYENPAR